MNFVYGIVLGFLVINLISDIYIYQNINVLYKQIKQIQDINVSKQIFERNFSRGIGVGMVPIEDTIRKIEKITNKTDFESAEFALLQVFKNICQKNDLDF